MAGDYQYEIMKDLSGFFKPGQRKAIYNSTESLRDKVLIRVLWKSGRRIGEILQAKVSDIDFNNSSILWHIEKKTQKVEGIKIKKDLRKWKPIDSFTLRLLNFYIKREYLKQESYLFPSPIKYDSPITRQRAFQIVRRSCKNAGIDFVGEKKPHPHTFRHSLAVDMAKKLKTPADFRRLQMFLEHANIGITEQYLQFNDEEMREILEDTENEQ